jgi:hypothetical protein
MEHFAGLDVSVNKTSVCIVDDAGRMVREAKVASEPEALLQVLKSGGYRFKRIGLESSTARWNDVPRGTMDEVRSYVRLDLPSGDGKADPKIVPPRSRIPYWKGLLRRVRREARARE